MLLLAILVLSLLAYLNYKVASKAVFHPAVSFSAIWALGLLFIWMIGSLFYPLAPETLLVFVSGAVTLTLGSALAAFYPPSEPSRFKAEPREASWSNWILNALVVLVFCATPFAVRWLVNTISEHPSSSFFVSASLTMLDDTLKRDPGFVLFSNIVTLADIVAVLAFAERRNHQKRCLIALVLAVLLNVLIAGRSGIVTVILSILCVDWIQSRRLRWKLLISMGFVFMVLVIAIAILLGKAGADPHASLADNSAPVARGLALYAAGGVVAFDRVLRNPGLMPRDFQISLFFVQTLNKLGANLPLPNTSVGFLDVGPELNTNVYTIYFTYLDMGYWLMMVMLAFLGFVLTRYYNQALAGGKISTVLYASLWSGLVLSLFAELFFDNLNFLLKVYVLSWLVYSLPASWLRFRSFISHAVERRLPDIFSGLKA